jgi:hypothetical protein
MVYFDQRTKYAQQQHNSFPVGRRNTMRPIDFEKSTIIAATHLGKTVNIVDQTSSQIYHSCL